MKITRNNLTIVEHCTDKPLSGFLTNGLQFTKTGTLVINRCYSVAVSALETADGEATGCISSETVKDLMGRMGNDPNTIDINKLPLMRGSAPVVKLPDNPVQFELTLSANFLLKLAQSVRDFTGPEEAIVRIQFTGKADPVRMDARNTKTGQKWEALLMPRAPGTDNERFAEQLQQAKARQEPIGPDNRQAIPIPPPPPVEEDEFEKALRLAQGL